MESRIFTPVTFGPVTLRNRVIRSAAVENMAYGNRPSQDLMDYHVAVARGGVGIHASHGYLISQFLSPYTNRRHDHYGGSLENRMRVMQLVVRRVMEVAGDDLGVLVKMNMHDGFRRGMQEAECLEVARELERLGVHGIVLSGGHRHAALQTGPEVDEAGCARRPDPHAAMAGAAGAARHVPRAARDQSGMYEHLAPGPARSAAGAGYRQVMGKVQISLCLLLAAVLPLSAQRYETVPFGDFEHWTVRHLKESAILGGEEVTLYVVGPDEVFDGNRAYDYARTPWASSNAYARVSGITKTSLSVEPDDGPDGKCARLTTVLTSCKAAGIVDINALATGSLYWGKLFEPITGTRNPFAKIDWGIPFTGRPDALVLDYKATLPASGTLTHASSFRVKHFPGEDPCQVTLVLQHRWEDADGQVHAERVGTAFFRISRSTAGWVKNHRIPIWYGDARQRPGYQSYMGLIQGKRTLYTVNSKGRRVPILEENWAEGDAPVTHAVLQLSSGSSEEFTGEPGNTLWVDNIRMEYAR